MNPKILLCLALGLSGMLPMVFIFPVLARDATVTDAIKFSELAIPESPSQHKRWIPPATDLPTSLISAVKVLFDLGLADPRGCEYREFEATTGSIWGQTNRIEAHGWVLPARSGLRQAFAIGWDGLIYPAVLAGKKADLKQDMEALLQADELWRMTVATNRFASRGAWLWNSQDFLMSHTSMTAIKVALLLRLGEGKLARAYWQAWRAVRTMNEEEAHGPFRALAGEWSSTQFGRGVSAFMRADDALALADFRQLNRRGPELEKEMSRRGFWRPRPENGQTPPYFAFLQPVSELLADEERRTTEAPHPSVLHLGLDKFPDKSKRIAALISDLDQISQRQRSFPGSVSLGLNPVVKALIAEGDGAVDPLLDCLEKDTRLTRSADLDHNFRPYHMIPVRQCAQAALDDMLKVHCESPGEYRA